MNQVVKVVAIVGIASILLVSCMTLMAWPMADEQFAESWKVTMTADNDASHWADPLGVADDDLWASGESDCNNAIHKCTVLVTATRVSSGSNTIVPMEGLIRFKVTRTSNNPDIPDSEDYATPTIRFSYAHATWTNGTDGSTHKGVYSDADGNWIVYVEQGLTAGARLLASGEVKSLNFHQPGDSINYYLGFKLNPSGFGADGQTANISSLTLTGEIAKYSFTVVLSVVAIS